MNRRAALGSALAVALALPALADDDPGIYPAAQCAALWFGQDDYAHATTLLAPDPQDVKLAEAFRQVARRLTNRDAAAIDAFIAQQRPLMAFMVEDYIYSGNRHSRELYERMMRDCSDFGATQPETSGLR